MPRWKHGSCECPLITKSYYAHSIKLIEQLEEAILLLLQEFPAKKTPNQSKKQEKDRHKDQSRDVLNIFRKCMLSYPFLRAWILSTMFRFAPSTRYWRHVARPSSFRSAGAQATRATQNTECNTPEVFTNPCHHWNSQHLPFFSPSNHGGTYLWRVWTARPVSVPSTTFNRNHHQR